MKTGINIVFCFLFLFGKVLSMPSFPSTKIKYIVNGDTLSQPYYRNISLDSATADIKYAFISLHGDGRNADTHFNILSQASINAGIQDSAIILAPVFPIQEDVVQYNLGEDILYWSDSDWNAGDLSRDTQTNPRPFRISSFSTMDTIYHRLINNFNSLEKIILTGHSAGSQMVVRYASGGRAEQSLTQTGVEFIYIPTNTPSFLYFDDNRVIDEGVSAFEFGQTDCVNASQYKYGMENLNQYMGETGSEQIIEKHKNTKIIYLIGQYDFGGQTSTCARMVQGYSRLIRTHIYFSYLGYFYGDEVYDNNQMIEIPGASHDFNMIVSSECGMHALFDFGDCDLYIDGNELFNNSPKANAGIDQIVNVGSVVNLNASDSYDEDGEVVGYEWSQILGQEVGIVSPDSVYAHFVFPNQSSDVHIQLQVVDNEQAVGLDTVVVFLNAPPIANAGEDHEVGFSEVVILDGSNSSDDNDQIESYYWEQISGPPVSIFSSNQEIATVFSPNFNTELSFLLRVYDEHGLSDVDTVRIFISSLFINNDMIKANDSGVKLFPNPFNSSLLLDFSNNKTHIFQKIVIYNITGEVIKQWNIKKEDRVYWEAKNDNGIEINSGLYFISFISKNTTIIKKVTYLK